MGVSIIARGLQTSTQGGMRQHRLPSLSPTPLSRWLLRLQVEFTQLVTTIYITTPGKEHPGRQGRTQGSTPYTAQPQGRSTPAGKGGPREVLHTQHNPREGAPSGRQGRTQGGSTITPSASQPQGRSTHTQHMTGKNWDSTTNGSALCTC
jgi:hypothetical protein